MPDVPAATPSGGAPRPQPNYAARRMLVTTIGITAVVAIALVGWRAVKGDTDSSTSATGTWDQIALIDRTTGDVTMVDEGGQVRSEIVGLGRVSETHTFGSRMALVGVDQIVIVDTQDSEVEPTIIPFDRGSTITPAPTTDTLHLIIGKPTGGNVLIVDVASGDVIDVFGAADPVKPLIFAETVRWAADGSTFAAADAANFQTILVRPGVATATFLPDQPLAVGDELVATSETVGLQVDIALVDHARRDQAKVRAEIPAGGVMIDDQLVMVSVDGGMYRIKRGDEFADQIGTIAVPAGDRVRLVRPSFDHQRLVVSGDMFEAVVDLEGDTIFITSFATAVAVAAPHPAWSCLPVGGGDAFHSLISLDSGEQLADLTGLEVTGTSSDGCTVIGERGGISEVIGREGSVRLGQLREARLGPDGRTVVWTTTTGQTELLTIDDEFDLSDPIDLSHAGSTNLTVAFLAD
jgi:hypothetical protein